MDGLRGRRRAAVLAAGTGGVLAYYVGPHAAGLAHVVTRVTENGPDFQVWGVGTCSSSQVKPGTCRWWPSRVSVRSRGSRRNLV